MSKRAADKTVSAGLEFFSAWFCPYAQRAWIALEHHGLKYRKIEGLLPDAPGEDFKGYKKHPRLLELNPKGLVPTLAEDGMPPVYESSVCVEYIDEIAACCGERPSLMPGTPAERAALRLKVDWINKNLCSPFYQVLVRTSTEDREAALKMLQCSIDELEAWIKGPYFMGEQLTAADIAFIPWAYRILHCKILERFRGPAFALDLATRPKLAKWLDSVLATEAVKATLAEPEALCGTYKRYADNTALSKVAEAVRQGKTADSV
ncbi:Glutathione S-transferase U16 (AtGSTU16) (GST class-tau member 16) [Durusdinium trenchii]|uniref:Glutathione S-transferase U16 (AtGSTU16) (GST class-tau member 16) n=1 Tax=Durusdinium trenchii TaxID=1381693 RepID=A0ABP0LKT3_9DINO